MKRGKWRSAALCLALIVCLAGCGKETDAATKETGSQSTGVGDLQESFSVEELQESTVETASASTSAT